MALDTNSKKTFSKWAFNPFQYIAGRDALVLGIVMIIVASIVGSYSNSHFDGILDFHTGAPASLEFFIIEGIIDWLIMGLLLLFAGLLISKSKFRVIDVIGTQALARFPSIIIALIALLPSFQETISRLAVEPTNIKSLIGNNFIVLIGLLIILVITIWMVILMYKAFSVSCNVKGGKAVTFFIVVIIIGEILSKVVLISLANSNYFIVKNMGTETKKEAVEVNQKLPKKKSVAEKNSYQAQPDIAHDTALQWLQLIDDRKYIDSWDGTSDYFKNSITRKKWEDALVSVRSPLGNLVSRDLISKKPIKHNQIVFLFQTSYQFKKKAIETVTVEKDIEGAWKIAGYYIK